MQESCLQFLRALGLGPDLSGRVCIRVSLCGVWVVAFEVLLRPPQSLLSTVVLCVSFVRKNKEMLEYMAPLVGNPGEYWNYRDESWVGFWASASHQRGGANRVATLVLNFLNRYRALEGI